MQEPTSFDLQVLNLLRYANGERRGLSPGVCRFESCPEYCLKFGGRKWEVEVSEYESSHFRPPTSHLKRVVFPWPDCNPGVKK